MGVVKLNRFEVWLINLDPTQGSEIKKERLCIIVSPPEMMRLATVLVAPMTTKGRAYPCRVQCSFQGKTGLILPDQMRAVDKSRFTRKLGKIDAATQIELCDLLQEIFAYK